MLNHVVRLKLGYAAVPLLAGIIAIAIGFLPVTSDSWKRGRIARSLTVPIVVPSDSMGIGTPRCEVEEFLGKPRKVSVDKDTYYYFRRLENPKKDQILVIRFADDKVILIDSNVNLGTATAVSTSTR